LAIQILKTAMLKPSNTLLSVSVAILLALLFNACEDDFDYEMPPFEEKIVVDGYIEQGKPAVVTLMKNTPHNSTINSSSYYNLVATRAKVVLQSGEEEEVLTLTQNKGKFPPHYYRSYRIKGKVNGTYKLKVYLSGDSVEATTTIPAPVPIDSAWFELAKHEDSLGFVWLSFKDDENAANYYRTFTQVASQNSHYIANRLSVISDTYQNGKIINYPLYQGIRLATEQLTEHRYKLGDSVSVRLCTMDEQSYLFWTDYNANMLDAGNPFSSGGTNLKSNVKNGLGIWCGYGASYYQIVCK